MQLVATTCICASDSITFNPRVRRATETSALFNVKGTKRVKITEFEWNEEMHWMQISDWDSECVSQVLKWREIPQTNMFEEKLGGF